MERFTERARQVVVLAQEEARKNGANAIGCEYLLIGLLREDEGLAARILASMDVTLEKARESVQARLTGSGEGKEGQIPFTPRAQKALELALREALGLGHNYIGTEHILLGLVREYDNVAMEILRDDFNLVDEGIRSEVIRMLSGPKSPQVSRNPKDSKPAGSPEPQVLRKMVNMDPVDLDDLLSLAVTLGRQHPDVPAERIIKAAKALH